MNRDFDLENYWQEQFRRQDLGQEQYEVMRQQILNLQQRVQELEEALAQADGAL